MDLRLPLDPAEAREEFRCLLQSDAFLRAGPGQPLRNGAGDNVDWMFYNWQVTLTERGAALAAFCVLEQLKGFRSTQLATYGYTGMPIISACVLLGGGKYTGLCIREVRKGYGSMRRIEGPADRTRPVVLVDDSLVTGTSMLEALAALEAEGFTVEAAVGLVHFPGRGGAARLRERGVSVACIFDVHRDLGAPPLPQMPGYRSLLPDRWAEPSINQGLHPALAARQVAERYLMTGMVPRPPERFDAEYDGRGGVFISMRERGSWHFDSAEASPTRDLVLATIATLDSAEQILLERLCNLKIAVTWLGPQERITPSKLKFSTYGIVVRSEFGDRAGGALPNTQYFLGELEQYYHARWVNAEVGAEEPHELFRHTVQKCVEPDAQWLTFGSPSALPDWTRDTKIGQRLTERVRELVLAAARGILPSDSPVPDELIPASVYMVAVTLRRNGAFGCGVSWEETLDNCLQQAARAASDDPRFSAEWRAVRSTEIAISVSILHDQERLGDVRIEDAAAKMRRGFDSLSIEHKCGGAILLSDLCIYENLSKEEMAQKLLHNEGDPLPPLDWAIYPTATWLDDGDGCRRLNFGFPDRSDQTYEANRWQADVERLADYVLRHRSADGLPEYEYRPVSGTSDEHGFAARKVHALLALGEAGRTLVRSDWREAAKKGIQYCLRHVHASKGGKATLALPNDEPSPIADCVLLLATARIFDGNLDNMVFELAQRVRALVQTDGRIIDCPDARGLEPDHEFLPGLVILALARFAENHGDCTLLNGLQEVLNWYRRRFQLCHPWGLVGWFCQAGAVVHSMTGDPGWAEFVWEMADWALDWQHETSGAFLCDLQPEGLSCHTAFIAEGIAAAWQLAEQQRDPLRVERYRRSCGEAYRFMNQLIIREEDTFCMIEPHRALGGVRGALFTSDVRIDYVSHTLLAIAAGVANQAVGPIFSRAHDQY
jgi:orotate phosphoribosyltransferase/AMMECR1 domain-containing protein